MDSAVMCLYLQDWYVSPILVTVSLLLERTIRITVYLLTAARGQH
jgi:hypothetical protein